MLNNTNAKICLAFVFPTSSVSGVKPTKTLERERRAVNALEITKTHLSLLVAAKRSQEQTFNVCVYTLIHALLLLCFLEARFVCLH